MGEENLPCNISETVIPQYPSPAEARSPTVQIVDFNHHYKICTDLTHIGTFQAYIGATKGPWGTSKNCTGSLNCGLELVNFQFLTLASTSLLNILPKSFNSFPVFFPILISFAHLSLLTDPWGCALC
jgi:hypothetical protein